MLHSTEGTENAGPVRTCEAIIRSFPGRVLTVTVLCARKRPLSFDSCAPAAAKRARIDGHATQVIFVLEGAALYARVCFNASLFQCSAFLVRARPFCCLPTKRTVQCVRSGLVHSHYIGVSAEKLRTHKSAEMKSNIQICAS